MTTQQRLLKFAKEIAYPHILQLPFYLEHENQISVLLVGSVATGLCADTSDVDICLLCREHIFNDISKNTDWIKGRPTEIIMNETQIHYYAISYETIEKKLSEYDDTAFYVYGNSIALNDNSGLNNELQKNIYDGDIKTKRKEKALDMLIRRNRALKSIFSIEADPIIRIHIGIEIIEHILKVAALLDDVQFDKRKRFYTTALTGKIGLKIKPNIDKLITSISQISRMGNEEESRNFLRIVDECIEIIQ